MKYIVLGLLLPLFFIGCTNNKNVSTPSPSNVTNEVSSKKIFSEKSKLENFEKFSNIIDNSIKYSDKKTELLEIKTELYLSILKKIDKSVKIYNVCDMDSLESTISSLEL